MKNHGIYKTSIGMQYHSLYSLFHAFTIYFSQFSVLYELYIKYLLTVLKLYIYLKKIQYITGTFFFFKF